MPKRGWNPRGWRPEERIGLAIALGLHVGVIAALLLRPPAPPPPPPARMEVTLADSVGLHAAAPQPTSNAAADLAPTLGAAPPQHAAPPHPAPPAPVRPAQLASVKPPVTTTAPQHPPKPRSAPPAPAAPSDTADPIAAALASPTPHDRPVGGGRIGANFLKGLTVANTTGKAKAAPALVAGPEVQASLAAAIARQLKPHWQPPQGVDSDKLVTYLDVSLNPDGTLADEPRLLRQGGITESNRPQAARHAEEAIRAVKLAQPFHLPPDYYQSWKRLNPLRFDRNLGT